MANPILNDKQFEDARSGWAAPAAPSPGGDVWPAPGQTAPVTDGPVSPWRAGAMTVRGTITATAVLFTLLMITATMGYLQTPDAEQLPDGTYEFSFPGLAMVGVVVGFVAVIALYFKPRWAKFLGPVYALAQGFFVGAISKVYENI